MYKPFGRHMPSFLAVHKETVTTQRELAPKPPSRKSSHCRTALRASAAAQKDPAAASLKRPTSANSKRHEQCFLPPKGTPHKFATLQTRAKTVAKQPKQEALCRSKSAGAVSSATYLSLHNRQPPTFEACVREVARDTRISQIRHSLRLQASSPAAGIQRLRQHAQRLSSNSPVAFGRSISKERSFAEEKKRLENALPAGWANFEASTNILRDPSLKSPAEVKKAVRSYATCPLHGHGRSKSLPRATSPHKHPSYSVSTTTRHSMCFPQSSEVKHFNVLSTKQPTAPTSNLKSCCSTASLARTNSTFSVNSTASKAVQARANTKETKPIEHKKVELTNAAKKVTTKKPTPNTAICKQASTQVQAKVSKNESNVLRRTKAPLDTGAKTKQPAEEPSQFYYETHYFRAASPTVDLVGDSKIYKQNTQPTGELNWSSEVERASAGTTAEICWRLEQNEPHAIKRHAALPPARDIARPESPAHKHLESDFSPTREVRVPPQQQRSEVRSPSRRRIESLRPKVKLSTEKVIRASSLSSADDRSKRGLYLCSDFAHSATSLASSDRHSPTCPYRSNTERFNDLSRFYNTLERIGQLERATSDTSIKPIRREGTPLDFEEWRRLRLHERAEKELAYLVEKMKQEQREKDFIFRSKDVDELKWKEEKDFGLRSRDKSVEDIRERLERKIQDDWLQHEAKKEQQEWRKELHKPFWRNHTVADLASSLEIKYNPENKLFAVQQKGKQVEVPPQGDCLSNQLVSTLNDDQLQRITQQLHEIYSPETREAAVNEKFVVTVNARDKKKQKPAGLKVRSNSSISKNELMGSFMRRKEAANKLVTANKQRQRVELNEAATAENKTKQTTKRTRSESPVYLARETRGAIAAEHAKATLPSGAIPIPPPLPKSTLYTAPKCRRSKCKQQQDQVAQAAKDSELNKKIQYFEERQYEEPPKTIYHAREDSSPDEEEVMRVVEENIQARRSNLRKELTASLNDLRELYGEKSSHRYLSPKEWADVPYLTELHTRAPIVHEEELIECDAYYPYNAQQDEQGFDSITSILRSRSISPMPPQARDTSEELEQLLPTSEVRKIKDKFESYNRCHKQHPFFGVRPLRQVRSDPELNNAAEDSKDACGRSTVTFDECGDVSWIAQKFELRDRLQKRSFERGRRRIRQNRFMPHIDIISKSAALKSNIARHYHSSSASASASASVSPSPTRHSGEYVERTRSFFEQNARENVPKPLSPTTEALKLSNHLSADWIAHRHPSPQENALAQVKEHAAAKAIEPQSKGESKAAQLKRALKKLREQRHSNSLSPTRHKKQPQKRPESSAALPAPILPPRKPILSTAKPKTQADAFANQEFDPKKHQPKARYVPNAQKQDYWRKCNQVFDPKKHRPKARYVPDAEQSSQFWKKSSEHANCSGTCVCLRGRKG